MPCAAAVPNPIILFCALLREIIPLCVPLQKTTICSLTFRMIGLRSLRYDALGVRKDNLTPNKDCESFARRTFTTPKIRTFTTPKFGHFPPPKTNICQEDNCHPHFFSSFLGFFDLQLMEDIKDGKEEVLDEVVMEHIK